MLRCLCLYLSLFFANGHAIPPIFLIAVDSLNENQVIYEKFPLLSHSLGVNDYGYLVFAKSRAGTEKFFKWLFLEVIFVELDAQIEVVRYSGSSTSQQEECVSADVTLLM